MTKNYERLLHRICVDLGWCGSIVDGQDRHVHDFLPDSGRVSVEQFVEWVILADGEDPKGQLSQERQWRERLEAVFIECMGARDFDVEEARS
jgi:hypothetical protein